MSAKLRSHPLGLDRLQRPDLGPRGTTCLCGARRIVETNSDSGPAAGLAADFQARTDELRALSHAEKAEVSPGSEISWGAGHFKADPVVVHLKAEAFIAISDIQAGLRRA